MRKSIIEPNPREASESEHEWLDLEALAQVEISSEDEAHPVEAALVPGGGYWRAAIAGEQTLRLLFDRAQQVRAIRLIFQESSKERTQEFVLRWSADGRSYHDVARQQYNFSSPDSTRELEEYNVELDGVTALELCIMPDISGGDSRASLAEWRVA
jgi:hypothetical protein